MISDFQMPPGFSSSMLHSKTNTIIREGKIVEVKCDDKAMPSDKDDHWFSNIDINSNFRGCLYRVEFGDNVDYWIPSLTHGGGDHTPYKKDTLVLVSCQDGNPNYGIILGAIPTNNMRPPVGFDDTSSDKRPWRETVYRYTFDDGAGREYDEYLHRWCEWYKDGSYKMFWFEDDREDRSSREKEALSDITGVPARHYQFEHFADGLDITICWDEHYQTHYRNQKWPDTAFFEYMWDEKNQFHSLTEIMADGAESKYIFNELHETHQRYYKIPDNYSKDYLWDESTGTHTETITYNDGSVKTFYVKDKDGVELVDKVEYSDNTILAFEKTPAKHIHEFKYSDGSRFRYDFNTKTLSILTPVAIYLESPATTVTGTFVIDGNSTFHGDVTIKGHVNIVEGLAVSGGAGISGGVTVTGDGLITGNLDVLGSNPNHHAH